MLTSCGLHSSVLLLWALSDEILCDGVGVACLLNATLVLPKFEVAAYWNESRYPLYAKAVFCQPYLQHEETGKPARNRAGDGLMELEGLTSVYTNIFTESTLHSVEDFANMHRNTEAALDYYLSISSDSYVATYFGNMDKVVAAMRGFKGLPRTLFLSRRGFAVLTSQGLKGKALLEALWKVHGDEFVMGVGSAFVNSSYEIGFLIFIFLS